MKTTEFDKNTYTIPEANSDNSEAPAPRKRSRRWLLGVGGGALAGALVGCAPSTDGDPLGSNPGALESTPDDSGDQLPSQKAVVDKIRETATPLPEQLSAAEYTSDGAAYNTHVVEDPQAWVEAYARQVSQWLNSINEDFEPSADVEAEIYSLAAELTQNTDEPAAEAIYGQPNYRSTQGDSDAMVGTLRDLHTAVVLAKVRAATEGKEFNITIDVTDTTVNDRGDEFNYNLIIGYNGDETQFATVADQMVGTDLDFKDGEPLSRTIRPDIRKIDGDTSGDAYEVIYVASDKQTETTSI